MNRLLQRLMFFLIACLLAAAPLQAQTNVDWKIPPVNQDFANPANWTGTVDGDAWLHVNTATAGQFPKHTSGYPTIYGLYLGDAGAGELDITGAALNITGTLRVGMAAGAYTSTLKLTSAFVQKLDPNGGIGLENPIFGGGSGATTNVELTNSSMNMPLSSSVNFGRYAGGNCNLTMVNSTFNFGAGGTSGQYIGFIGRDGGTCVANLTNSTWNQINTSIQVGSGNGSHGTLNLMGASTVRIKPAGYDPNLPDLAGGMFYIGVGDDSEADTQGTVTMTGTSPTALSSTIVGGRVSIGNGPNVIGTLTMNQYSVLAAEDMELGPNGGNGTLTLNGATLQPRVNEPDFIKIDDQMGQRKIEICENGATFDVGTDQGGAPLTIGLNSLVNLQHGGASPTDGGLTKTGVGQLLINGISGYNGDTRVIEGTLGGAGELSQSRIVLGAAGTLVPGDPENSSFLMAAGIVASDGGVIANRVDCTPYSGSANYLQVTGAASLTNTHFAPYFVNGTPNGTYTLLTAGSLIASGLVLDAASVIPNTRSTLELTWDTSSVYLTASGGGPLADVWTGAASGVWEANGAENWVNDGTDLKFMNLDHVAFLSNPGEAHPNITLNQHVYVADLYFQGDVNYVISGSGKITGDSNTTGGVLTRAGNPAATGSVDFRTDGNIFSQVNLYAGTMSFTNGANTADFMVMAPSTTLKLNGTGHLQITGRQDADGNGDSLLVGLYPGNTATLQLNDHSSLVVDNFSAIVGNRGGTGTLEMTGHSSMVAGGGVLFIGLYGGNGTLVMSGGTSPTDLGSHLQVEGTLSCGNSPNDAGTAYGQCDLHMSGYSSIYARDGFEIGTNGGSGTLDMSGHAVVVTGPGGFRLGSWGGGGVGTATLSGSSSITTDYIHLGVDGTFGTLYLNGGTLRPTQNHTDFINKPSGNVFVCEGGATFDVGTDGGRTPLAIGGIGIELLHGYLGAEDVPDGGLTKTGVGTLVLTAMPTYTGNTDIQEGMLQLAVPGEVVLTTVTGAGALSVCSDTTLTATSIQVDTLSIGDSQIPIGASLATVPEPGTIVLLFLAGLMIAGARFRRK
jgi:fibronectin-binding autotransporter adhesin